MRRPSWESERLPHELEKGVICLKYCPRYLKLIDCDTSPSALAPPFPAYIEEMLQNIDPKAVSEGERCTDGLRRLESERTKRMPYSDSPSGSDTGTGASFTNVGRLLSEDIKPTAPRSQIRSIVDKACQGTRMPPRQMISRIALSRTATNSSTYTNYTNRPHTVLDTSINGLNGGTSIRPEYESVQRPPTMTMWQLERMLHKSGNYAKEKPQRHS